MLVSEHANNIFKTQSINPHDSEKIIHSIFFLLVTFSLPANQKSTIHTIMLAVNSFMRLTDVPTQVCILLGDMYLFMSGGGFADLFFSGCCSKPTEIIIVVVVTKVNPVDLN